MRVSELLAALDELRQKLIEHRDLWGNSLIQPIPDYPVRNQKELEAQSHWLKRRLGALRSYIERFDDEWLMVHPATGVRWDALDASVSLNQVAQAKGPSIRSTIEKLNTIAGKLETLDQDDDIPADRNAPLKSGLAPDRIMLAYLNHLHPYIAHGCAKLFVDGHYAQAVSGEGRLLVACTKTMSLKLEAEVLNGFRLGVSCTSTRPMRVSILRRRPSRQPTSLRST